MSIALDILYVSIFTVSVIITSFILHIKLGEILGTLITGTGAGIVIFVCSRRFDIAWGAALSALALAYFLKGPDSDEDGSDDFFDDDDYYGDYSDEERLWPWRWRWWQRWWQRRRQRWW